MVVRGSSAKSRWKVLLRELLLGAEGSRREKSGRGLDMGSPAGLSPCWGGGLVCEACREAAALEAFLQMSTATLHRCSRGRDR